MAQYSYTLLFQKLNTPSSTKDDKQLVEEFHSSLREFIEIEVNEKKKNNAESIQRAIARLRGLLIPYLSTPLKSDKDDIERSIKETMDDVLVQAGFSSTDAVIASEVLRVVEPVQIQLHRQLVGVVKRLLKNGKTMLAQTGISSGKNSGAPYVLQISFEGFFIAATIQQSAGRFKEASKFHDVGILNDALSETLAIHTQGSNNDSHSIVLYFNALNGEIEKLKTIIPTLPHQFGIREVKLSKRQFYSGMGSPYQLQITSNLKKHPLGTILMAATGGYAELEAALTGHSSLIVLEKMP